MTVETNAVINGGDSFTVVQAEGVTDWYFMPEPTGSNDSSLFVAALASSKKYVWLRQGTYLIGTAVTGLTDKIFVGRGRTATTIKMQDSANLNTCFSPSVSATNVEFWHLTYDGNTANQASGSGSFVDMVTNAVSNFRFMYCGFQNIRSSNGFGKFGAGSTGLEVGFCRFTDAQITHISLEGTGGCTDVNIHHNYFTKWGQRTPGAQTDAAIWSLNGTSGSAAYDGINISDNYFLQQGTGTFCVESVVTGVVYHNGFAICRNLMNGSGTRGTGVSGFFSNSVIADNVMFNGGDDAGAWTGWRNGIELFGTNLVVRGNVVENGAIVVDGARPGYSNGVGNVIQGNVVKNILATSTGVTGIQLRGQDDFICEGNSVTITLSGSATMQAAIYVGTYSSAGTLNRGKVINNVLRLTSTASGHGVRVVTSASSDVEIDNNVMSGFASGLTYQSNTNDTNLRARNNNLWNNTVATTNTPTGTGFVEQGNILVTGQLQIMNDGAQSFAPAAAGTVTIDCRLGLQANITLPAGNITIAAPTNARPGMTLYIDLLQDGVGGRTITWNATFKKAADGAGTASQRGTTAFRYNGTNWVQFGGALTFFT